MEPYNDDSTIFPATFSKFSIFPLGGNRVLLTGPGIYPQIYHRTPFPEVIICKRFKWKLKGGVGSFWILQMEILFYVLWEPNALEGNLTIKPSFSRLPKKAFLSRSVWLRRECTWTLIWKKSLLICFKNCQGVSYSHSLWRKRMMNTFTIVNVKHLHMSETV